MLRGRHAASVSGFGPATVVFSFQFVKRLESRVRELVDSTQLWEFQLNHGSFKELVLREDFEEFFQEFIDIHLPSW